MNRVKGEMHQDVLKPPASVASPHLYLRRRLVDTQTSCHCSLPPKRCHRPKSRIGYYSNVVIKVVYQGYLNRRHPVWTIIARNLLKTAFHRLVLKEEGPNHTDIPKHQRGDTKTMRTLIRKCNKTCKRVMLRTRSPTNMKSPDVLAWRAMMLLKWLHSSLSSFSCIKRMMMANN